MCFLVIKQLVVMMLIAVSGFAVTRFFKFGMAEQRFVSKVLIYFINPCLIFSRFDMPFDSSRLKAFFIVLLIAVIIHLVMIAVSLVFIRPVQNDEAGLYQIDRLGVVFTNCGFIGIPLIDGIFPGTDGVFYLLPFIVTFNVFLWIFGYKSFCGRVNLKKLITNPNIISVLLGILLFCLPFKLPYVISTPVKSIAGMNTAMAMFLLGMLFANFHGFNSSYISRIIKLCLVRFVVVMIFSLAICFAVFRILSSMPDIRLICYVCYIASLCPVGMSVSSFAVLFEKDESYAGLCVLATSILCVITLPISVALAGLLF